MVSDNPESFADLDGHTMAQTALVWNNCPTGECSDGQNRAEELGVGAQLANAALDWANSIEVSASYGVGLAANGQIGTAEGNAVLGNETEVKSGLAGGDKEISNFTGGKASAKVGPAEGEIKVGITASSKDGVTAAGEAKGNVGTAGGKISVDKNGVHTEAGFDTQKDVKLSGHLQAGVGLGVGVNFSQVGRAYDSTVKAFNALGQALVNAVMPKSLQNLP